MSKTKKLTRDKQKIAGVGYLEEIDKLAEDRPPKIRTRIRRRTIDGLIKLRQQFDKEVPKRTLESTLLLGTWNIRAFGRGGKRQLFDECYVYMASILRHFDLIAIQEVKDIEPLEKVTALMGPWWKYLLTDVTYGSQDVYGSTGFKEGNAERLAFVYDSRKVEFDGLVGEVVVPSYKEYDLTDDALKNIEEALQLRAKTPAISAKLATEALAKLKKLQSDEPEDAASFRKHFDAIFPKPERGAKAEKADRKKLWDEVVEQTGRMVEVRQFARTPFVCGFRSGWTQFQLCTVHTVYGGGKSEKRRGHEIRMLASILKEQSDKHGANVVLLGDMNAFKGKVDSLNKKQKDEVGGPIEALEANGFDIPEKIKYETSNLKSLSEESRQPFDQIAVSSGKTMFYLTENCGVFDFYQSVFRDDQIEAYAEELDLPPVTKDFTKAERVEKYHEKATWLMSDHLVKWVEIQTEYTDLALALRQHFEEEEDRPLLQIRKSKPRSFPNPEQGHKSLKISFHNRSDGDVDLWRVLDKAGNCEKLEPPIRYWKKDVKTSPNEVWKVTSVTKHPETLGYFVVGDTNANAIIPLVKKRK